MAKGSVNNDVGVPTVSLYIHENIAPEAIIRSVKRESPQPDLFVKPEIL